MVRDAPLDAPPPAAAADGIERALDCEVDAVQPIPTGLNALYRATLSNGDRVVLKLPTIVTDEEFRPEPRVLERLDRETAVPVPTVRAVVRAADGPLPAAYFVADYCEGRHVGDVSDLTEDAGEALAIECGRLLAAVHELSFGDAFGPLRVTDGGLRVESPRDSWGAYFLEKSGRQVDRLRGDGATADATAPFADLAARFEAAFERFPVGESPEAVFLHGDFRPANLVLSPPGDRPLVAAVIDPGAETGDGLLDLALAESALVDVPYGGTDQATDLRERLRGAYRSARSVSDRAFEARYPYYRLYAWAKALGGFDYFQQFARESTPAAAETRFRRSATRLLERC